MNKIITQDIKFEAKGNKIIRTVNEVSEIDYKRVYEEHRGIESSIEKQEDSIKQLETQAKDIPKNIVKIREIIEKGNGRLKSTKKLFPRAKEILRSKLKALTGQYKNEALNSLNDLKRDKSVDEKDWNWSRFHAYRQFLMTKKEIVEEIPEDIIKDLYVHGDNTIISIEDVSEKKM